MSYGILLSVEARHDLAALPTEVRRYTILQLEALAIAPTTLSTRSAFPYREKCQLFQFDYLHQGQVWEIAVLFQYGQDETSLHVIGVRRSHRPAVDDDDG